MIHFADKTRKRTDLEIDFAKTICTFDAKIVKKTGQKIEETKIIHIFAAEYYELACYTT